MTPEQLKKDREGFVQQQAKALAVYHQTSGAIAYIDSLLSRPMTESELKEVVGADSLEIVEQDAQTA